MPNELSNLEIDFDQIVEELRNYVDSEDAWKDLQLSGVGQTLLEVPAAAATFLRFSVERALQEAFPDTAYNESSLYFIARLVGVNPRRRKSAKTTGTLDLGGALGVSFTIPALSQFDIDGVVFYNPDDITFNTGEVSKSGIVLEQGEIVVESHSATGLDFQEIYISSNFIANETLLEVTVSTVPYNRERNSLWTYGPTDLVFLESTMPDGSVRITMPGAGYGKIPVADSEIFITYATSAGADANTANAGKSITLTTPITGFEAVDVTGVTEVAISGGLNRESAESLRFTAPRIYASQNRAITRNDWRSITLRFDGVVLADARARGEYEENSTTNVLMNVITLTVLPLETTDISEVVGVGDGVEVTFSGTLTPQILTKTLSFTDGTQIVTDDGLGGFTGDGTGTINYNTGAYSITFSAPGADTQNIVATYVQDGLSPAEESDLLLYLEDKYHLTTKVLLERPKEVPIDINATVHYFDDYDANVISDKVILNLNELFKRDRGILGRTIQLSDIYDSALEVDGVDYITLTSPTTISEVLPGEYLRARDFTINMTITDRT